MPSKQELGSMIFAKYQASASFDFYDSAVSVATRVDIDREVVGLWLRLGTPRGVGMSTISYINSTSSWSPKTSPRIFEMLSSNSCVYCLKDLSISASMAAKCT